ncbi:Uu.00g116980.m01.CDS01 [Anthostomella pinea]|uniref:Uu.00g116980.m01.CDS01 n=1 Tax=Anthostomella pinea TaxID=933095 RepID=A0AAI8YGW0_9PEZI|nr:Uu.00g116980.m01.CDS01 [Anthostomella pinea]
MNFNYHHGEHSSKQSSSYPTYTYNISASSPPTTASQVTILHDPRPEPDQSVVSDLPTPSPQQTIVPYAPTPPPARTLLSVPSEEEIYGPDRYSGHYPVALDNDTLPMRPAPAVHFNDQPQHFMAAPLSYLAGRDFKDELARAASMVTPGVDEVPYIRYALDALTKPREDDRMTGNTSSDSDEPFLPQPQANVALPAPTHHPETSTSIISDSLVLSAPAPKSPSAEEHLQARRQRRKELNGFDFDIDDLGDPLDYMERNMDPPVERSPPRTVDVWQAQPDVCEGGDMEKAQHFAPPLTYKPWILRPQSLLLLIALFVLMITALIFSAIYSIGRNGFMTYDGTIYGGQYFLFRILPQLLGAVLLLYAQSVVAAAFRILPFSAMASEDRRERRNAVFMPLYPKSFLWPQLAGPWNVWIPAINVWLMNITIPLLSGLFTVVLVDGTWTWSTVQGVAWTLVALYVSMLLSVLVMFVYWRQKRTGMMKDWDLRTIADLIFLVSQSNSLSQYRGLESVATRKGIRRALDGTTERLGYWFTPEVPSNYTFYGIGMPTTEEDLEAEKLDKQKWAEHRRESRLVSSDAGAVLTRRYLPWCFRDSQVVLFAVASAILLIALLVVSFVRSTDVRHGFLPGLSAGPLTGAFSPADFLYSFLPSLLGLILFLLFQSLDITLRILAPWGELARDEGSRAETSLLLDYAACLPWESTYKAIRNKHWRVAFITFLSPLFILLPVLGGGLFMALTPSSGVVRMFPNVPAFAIVLTLLFLYLFALASFVPFRSQYRLPHAVTCLAEILSFCCNEQLRTDPAFDFERVESHGHLRAQLDCGKDWHRQGRWTFGAGHNNDERPGIKRYSKYTVNKRKLSQYDRRAAGQVISLPLPRGSGSLFGRF